MTRFEMGRAVPAKYRLGRLVVPLVVWFAVCLAVCLPISACREDLNPGFCRADRDCGKGQSCSQDLSQPTRWHRCFSPDGGLDAVAEVSNAETGVTGDVAMGPDANGDAGNQGTADGGDDAPTSDDGGSDGTADVADGAGDGSKDSAFVCQDDKDCPTPGLPACDLPSGKCVACTGSNHCSGSRPVCDTTAMLCVGCLTRSDCPSTMPACDAASKTCVQCVAKTDCTGMRSVCDVASSSCVECLTRPDCPTARPACDVSSHTCLECLARTDCSGPRPACDTTAHACVGCLASTDCSAPTSVCDVPTKICVGCVARADCGGATPACDSAVTRTCVGCLARSDCAGATPACDTTAKMCVGCIANSDCAAPTPVCNGAAKACVGCLVRSDCSGSKPACDTTPHVCVGCLASSDCGGTTPVCDMTARTCVQCLTSAQCGGGAPICEGQLCRACKSDSECVAKSGADPGVCMSHQNGRCGTDAETIYVQNNVAVCSTTPGAGGTSATPYCRSQLAIDDVSPTRRLVVLRGAPALFPFAALMPGPQITIVGQNSATIAPGADIGIRVSGASLFVRNLKIAGGSSMGIFADSSATLILQKVSVDLNLGGGILIDGAAFAISDSSLTNNGPGDAMGNTWGGLLVKGLATSSPMSLTLVTVQGNKATGISCAAAILGTGVLAVGNIAMDISPTCAIASCAAAGPNCGATP